MALYSIRWKNSVRKDLAHLPKESVLSILNAIEKLAINPYSANTKKLVGTNKSLFRIRIGNYRVIYEINDKELIIHIIEIGHRKEIYR